MPRIDGLEATRRRRAAAPRVLILTTFDLDEYVYEALRAGASGFLLKDAPAEQLVSGVRVVAAGRRAARPSITRRLIEQFARRPPPSARAGRTRRADAARARGAAARRARALQRRDRRRAVVGDATVKTHVGARPAKLDLRDRVQAVVVAYESGLVQPGGG